MAPSSRQPRAHRAQCGFPSPHFTCRILRVLVKVRSQQSPLAAYLLAGDASCPDSGAANPRPLDGLRAVLSALHAASMAAPRMCCCAEPSVSAAGVAPHVAHVTRDVAGEQT